MKKLLFISIFALGITNTYAATCQTGNVYSDLECHEQQVQLIKPKINAAYAELKKFSKLGADKSFEQSQKLWLAWVEKDCAFSALPAQGMQGGGYGLTVAECKHERYAARLKQMRSVLQELKETAAQ